MWEEAKTCAESIEFIDLCSVYFFGFYSFNSISNQKPSLPQFLLQVENKNKVSICRFITFISTLITLHEKSTKIMFKCSRFVKVDSLK